MRNPGPRFNLSGQRVGLLVVGEFVGNRKWRCKCDCGAEHFVATGKLRDGTTLSCGCREGNLRHGQTVGGKATPTYSTWKAMWRRCTAPGSPFFSIYGGRGISVAPRWTSFEAFLFDMGEKPPGTSLDRIDNDLGYGPDNCRWATPSEQQANSGNAKLVAMDGIVDTIAAHARRLGIPKSTLRGKLLRDGLIAKGRNPPRALAAPSTCAGDGPNPERRNSPPAPEACGECGGTGRRPVYSAGEEMVAGFKPCPKCGGTGKVSK